MRYIDLSPQKWLIRGLLLIVFFGIYLYHINTYVLLAPLLILALIIHGRHFDLQNHWIIFLMMLVLTSITSVKMIESLKYTYMVFAVVIIVRQAVKAKDYREYVLKAVVALSAVEMFFVILQFLFPTFVNGINQILLPPDLYASMMQLLRFGSSYAGITADLPNAMFYSGMVFAYSIIQFVGTSKKRYLILGAAALLAILLTGKRSAVIINVGALVIMGVVFTYRLGRISTKMLALLVIVTAGGMYAIWNTSIGGALQAKNMAYLNIGDISNGRFGMIQEMYKIFRSRPITGIGSLSTKFYYGQNLGHNIYFQCLSENGLIGIAALLYLLVSNLVQNGRYLKEIHRYPSKDRWCDTRFGYLSLYVQLFFIIYGFFGNPLYGPIFLIPYVMFSVYSETKSYVYC